MKTDYKAELRNIYEELEDVKETIDYLLKTVHTILARGT